MMHEGRRDDRSCSSLVSQRVEKSSVLESTFFNILIPRVREGKLL